MESGIIGFCSSSSQKNLSLNSSYNTSFDDLSDELVVDILTRLPVKIIVQSTCVCKTWYSIIKNPSFISIHLVRSIYDAFNYYIFLIHTFSPSVTVITDNHHLTLHSILKLPFETRSKFQKLVGTCTGLVCLTDYPPLFGFDIYLVNPFIHKYRKLIITASCYEDLIGKVNCGAVDIQVGFGYSEVENDYKVIRIINCRSNTKPYVYNAKVEIYGLNSGKWKEVQVSISITPYVAPVFVHGCFYWCVGLKTGPDKYLICFDLKDEVFSRIELPTTYHELFFAWPYEILVKNDSLAFVLYDTSFSSLRICLLLLEKKFGGQVQWKEFHYECLDFNIWDCFGFSAMGFSGDGRLIMKWGFPAECMAAVDLDNSCAVEKLGLDVNDDIINGSTNVLESLVLFSN